MKRSFSEDDEDDQNKRHKWESDASIEDLPTEVRFFLLLCFSTTETLS